MSALGLAWVGEDTTSGARMNQKTIFVGTGTQLSNLSPTYPGQIAVSTTTASGFLVDVVYYRNADNTEWLFLSMSKHLHDSDTHPAGGLFRDILYANMYNYFTLNYDCIKETDMHKIGSGGTVTTDTTATTGRVIMDTGEVSGQYINFVDYGTKIDFSAKSKFAIRMGFNNDSNLIVRASVCGEDVNAANTTSNKYGIEGCDSTEFNWNIFSANASTRSGAIDTGSGLNAGYNTSGKYYRLDHDPVVGNIKFYDNGNNCGTDCTKTTFIPNTGDSGTDYVIRLGVKTTNGTGKKMALWGLKFLGKRGDSTWF